MILVKICGITRERDALEAVRWGADAIGLVLVPGSPRRVAEDVALRIRRAVAGRTACVGVFQDQPLPEVRRLAAELDLDYLQFHGGESPDFCREFGDRAYKAFWMRPDLERETIAAYRRACFLLDGIYSSWETPERVNPGRVDWDRIRELAGAGKVILAGGMDADKVGEAVREIRPYGVDVSRGVEERPGIKDPDRIRSFLAAVRGLPGKEGK